jgi:RNA polymerase sigma-70 factor, ECF subfamily
VRLRVCREVRLDGAAAEDFASSLRLAFLKDDCAILRSFEGRSSLPSFLTIVVRRLFIDERRLEGRWVFVGGSTAARTGGGSARAAHHREVI